MQSSWLKRYPFILCVVLVVATLRGGYAATESEPGEWEFSRIWELGGYIPHGALVHGHYFGFVFNSHACEQQYLWLTWSTYEEGLEKFKGETVSVRLDLGEDYADIDLTLMAVNRMTPLLSLVSLTNGQVTNNFIEELSRGTDLKVSVIGPPAVLEHLDIRGDLFDVRGLKAAHAQAVAQCGRGPVVYV